MKLMIFSTSNYYRNCLRVISVNAISQFGYCKILVSIYLIKLKTVDIAIFSLCNCIMKKVHEDKITASWLQDTKNLDEPPNWQQ